MYAQACEMLLNSRQLPLWLRENYVRVHATGERRTGDAEALEWLLAE